MTSAMLNPSYEKKDHNNQNNEKIPALADGYFFSLHENTWKLDKNKSICFLELKKICNPKIFNNYQKTLRYYAMHLSAAHTANVASTFLHMIRTTEAQQITPSILINYKASLPQQKEYYLGVIRGFLRKWYELGYEGIDKSIIKLLYGWRLKGNQKGDAVKRRDPIEGPLTDNELLAFNEGAINAFEKDLISLEQLVISLVTSHTGRRPIQISHLRIIDIVHGKNKKEEPYYLLNIPRAKHGEGFRAQFKLFAITEELWSLLSAQAEKNIDTINSILKKKLGQKDILQIPLFFDYSIANHLTSSSEFRALINTDKLHLPSHKITETLQDVVNISQIKSERTGSILSINSQRFRYTIGTRAAREGFGELVIAELLDHQDTQNSGVYIKNIPEHVKRLDEAVGFQLAPYAQAFNGTLVNSENEAKRGDDPSSKIRTESGLGLGTCGEYGFCAANVPIPCYTCIHFQPWLNGPHQEIYQSLLNERKRIEKITNDSEIAAILDRSIVAVADVIIRCQRRILELKEL